MKRAIIRYSMTACVTALFLAWTGRICADDAAATGKQQTTTGKQETFSGTITTVDEKERTVGVKGFWGTRTFEVGEHCKVSLEEKENGALKDLCTGHRVDVRYLAQSGVKVATQIAQKDVTYAGHISALDAAHRSFTVETATSAQTFVAGDDCKFVIREEKDQSLAGLRIGHKVTVRYLATPQGSAARRVDQLSRMFTGSIEAIDAETRTIKAQSFLSGKRFKLAGDCQIVVAGRLNGKLSDLRIGDKLTFNYDDLDGVLVANRIAREGLVAKDEQQQVSKAGSSAQ